MDRKFKIKKKGVALHEWVDRIADALILTDAQREAMHEVSKWSYIKDSRDTQEILLNKNE